MRVEHVTLGIKDPELQNEVIDSLAEAQVAGDTIREHRRGITVTYEDLLGEGRFDPTNPQHLSYAQALNMENYLYLAVVAFGLVQSVMASGRLYGHRGTWPWWNGTPAISAELTIGLEVSTLGSLDIPHKQV